MTGAAGHSTGSALAEVALPTASAGPSAAEWAAAVAAIRDLPAGARVQLICHVNPDGDALGSMLGFALGLRRLGVGELRATFPGPPEVPEPFRAMPGLDLLVPESEAYPESELVICFRTSQAACGLTVLAFTR